MSVDLPFLSQMRVCRCLWLRRAALTVPATELSAERSVDGPTTREANRVPDTQTLTPVESALKQIDLYMVDLSSRKLEATDVVIDNLLDVRTVVAELANQN